jgi:hypothetical protein
MLNKLRSIFKDGDVSLDHAVIKLPARGLEPLVKFYNPDVDKDVLWPVQIVVIYNVEQLAAEIAKHLKNGSDNGGGRSNDSQRSPSPS